MKKIIAVILAVVMTLALCACGSTAQNASQPAAEQGNTAAADTVYQWTLGTHHPDGTPAVQSIKQFIENLEAKTDGRIKITLSTGGALGSQREIVEAVNLGTIEIGYGETGVYSNYDEDLGTFILPFLFENKDEFYAAMDGAAGDYYSSILESKTNLRILAWFDGGKRDVYAKDELTSLDGMQGLKIRTPESSVYVELFKALGANPTSIAATEMYSAIQQGVVGAMEGSMDTAVNYNIYEVAKNCLQTGPIMCDCGLVINKNVYNSLPDDLKAILEECVTEMEASQRKLFCDLETGYYDQLVEFGVVFTPADLAKAKELVSDYVTSFLGDNEVRNELYDLIQQDIASVK